MSACVCRVKFDKEAMKSKLISANLKSTGQSKFALEEKDEVLSTSRSVLYGVKIL